jgi:hypothetical protein
VRYPEAASPCISDCDRQSDAIKVDCVDAFLRAD